MYDMILGEVSKKQGSKSPTQIVLMIVTFVDALLYKVYQKLFEL